MLHIYLFFLFFGHVFPITISSAHSSNQRSGPCPIDLVLVLFFLLDASLGGQVIVMVTREAER